MGVFAIIAALLIEQWRPLVERRSLQAAIGAWAAWLEHTFNGGEERHGLVAWLVAVLPPVIAAVEGLLEPCRPGADRGPQLPALAERPPLLDQQRGDDGEDTHLPDSSRRAPGRG